MSGRPGPHRRGAHCDSSAPIVPTSGRVEERCDCVTSGRAAVAAVAAAPTASAWCRCRSGGIASDPMVTGVDVVAVTPVSVVTVTLAVVSAGRVTIVSSSGSVPGHVVVCVPAPFPIRYV